MISNNSTQICIEKEDKNFSISPEQQTGSITGHVTGMQVLDPNGK
jgi:hypothetical protein